MSSSGGGLACQRRGRMEGGKTWVPSNPVLNPIGVLHFGQCLVPVGPAGALVFADRIIAVAGFEKGDPQIVAGFTRRYGSFHEFTPNKTYITRPKGTPSD